MGSQRRERKVPSDRRHAGTTKTCLGNQNERFVRQPQEGQLDGGGMGWGCLVHPLLWVQDEPVSADMWMVRLEENAVVFVRSRPVETDSQDKDVREFRLSPQLSASTIVWHYAI